MLNPTSRSGAVRDAGATPNVAAAADHPLAGATHPLAGAAHPLAGADWAPLVAALEAALDAAGYPLPEGLAAQVLADAWRPARDRPSRQALRGDDISLARDRPRPAQKKGLARDRRRASPAAVEDHSPKSESLDKPSSRSAPRRPTVGQAP